MSRGVDISRGTARRWRMLELVIVITLSALALWGVACATDPDVPETPRQAYSQ